MPPTPSTTSIIFRDAADVHEGVSDAPNLLDPTFQNDDSAFPHGTDSNFQLDAFHLRHESGGYVLVDPLVRGLVLRVPVSELKAKRIAGIEFVVVSGDQDRAAQYERWMKMEDGSNFFAEIPLLRE